MMARAGGVCGGAVLVAVTRCMRAPRHSSGTAQGVRRTPTGPRDELVPIIEDLIRLLDDVGEGLRHGRHPDRADSRRIGSVLRAVATDLEA